MARSGATLPGRSDEPPPRKEPPARSKAERHLVRSLLESTFQAADGRVRSRLDTF